MSLRMHVLPVFLVAVLSGACARTHTAGADRARSLVDAPHCDLLVRFDSSATFRSSTNALLHYHVENHGAAPVSLDLDALGSGILGLAFADSAGHPVYTFAPGPPPAGYVPERASLEPGHTRDFAVDLNVFSPPLHHGEYSVRVRALDPCGGEGRFTIE